MTSLEVTIVTEDVDRSVAKLMLTLSPPGIVGWMQSEMLQFLQERTSQRFGQEGDDATGPWAPLTTGTVSIRESQGYPAGPINHRTGELEDFITHAQADYNEVGRAVVMSYPADSGVPERLYDKLATAQKGAKASVGQAETPPRPVIALSETDLRYAGVSLAAYIAAANGGF